LKIINNMSENTTPDYSELSTPENFNPFDEPVVQRGIYKTQGYHMTLLQ